MRLSRPRVIGIFIGILVFAAVTAFIELDDDGETDRPPSETDATATATNGSAAGATPAPAGNTPATGVTELVPIDHGFVRTDLRRALVGAHPAQYGTAGAE